jgi:hypothetical protein
LRIKSNVQAVVRVESTAVYAVEQALSPNSKLWIGRQRHDAAISKVEGGK